MAAQKLFLLSAWEQRVPIQKMEPPDTSEASLSIDIKGIAVSKIWEDCNDLEKHQRIIKIKNQMNLK